MTYSSVVTVLALVGLTKKRFGHYAILKNLSLKSPRSVWTGNHKPGKHGKHGKLREFEKLSKSQGKLREKEKYLT